MMKICPKGRKTITAYLRTLSIVVYVAGAALLLLLLLVR
jgi:hypothetical protein